MSLSITLADLAGYIALLLWGTHMVQTGVQRAYSPNLRSVLGSALRNRSSAFFAGLGVTAALQSSTATGLIVSGLLPGTTSRYRYLPTIDAGGGGRWDPMSMLFFVPAALCWGKRWGTKPGPMRY